MTPRASRPGHLLPWGIIKIPRLATSIHYRLAIAKIESLANEFVCEKAVGIPIVRVAGISGIAKNRFAGWKFGVGRRRSDSDGNG